jgi:glycosyltransferase involved in cell wall biosynthesis
MNVSVIMPVHNGGRYLQQAVRSAAIHACVSEIIIVDDASSDNSAEIARELEKSDTRVSFLSSQLKNAEGPGAARNIGISRATSEWISFLDADDLYYLNRFSSSVATLGRVASCDGIYGFVNPIFEDDASQAKWADRYSSQCYGLRNSRPENVFENLLIGGRGHFHTNAITVRKCLLERAGLFDADLRLGQDSLMWLKLAAMGRLHPTADAQPVAAWRIHSKNRCFISPEQKYRLVTEVCERVIVWGEGGNLDAHRLELARTRLEHLRRGVSPSKRTTP